MFAVCVTFRLKPGRMDEFIPLMHSNAQTSLTQEQGCHRFDVLTDEDRPNEVFLYELYQNRDAFGVHLASGHFRSFDAAVSDMIAEKDIRTYTSVTS